jgi:putative exosortase-associated protein (TIGR04073 family)
MRKIFCIFAAAVVAAGVTGCAGPEHKLARGIDNTMELVRWGDMRRSVEQNAVFSAPNVSYSYGIVHGFDQSMCRAGLGIYEVVTFPIPSYNPVCTNKVPVTPQYPASYRPGLIAGSTFETDTYTGYSGGDIMPFVPGSRFNIFDN